ncbi:MAG: ATP-grasp domain-containing protein [Gemmatimonadales bacterium]
MRIAVVFDTPYSGWGPEAHWAEMEKEIGRWKTHEPDMEYQIGDALRGRGHEVCLVGVKDDLVAMLASLAAFQPELVINGAESFRGKASLDYVVAGLLEAEGYRYTGSPPMAALVTRNKAMSKKILAYHGLKVPGFVTYRANESVANPPELRFPLIVKPLASDASEGIARASVVATAEALAERVEFIHERFGQGAIAEEFIDGRELYVGMLGNGDAVDILPFTEMVFDKEKNRPEERIATRAAKWDEPYRDRRGVRNVFARRMSQEARAEIERTCRVAYRALWLRDYARLDVRLTPDGDVWFLEANANPFISYGHDMANMAEKTGLDYAAFIQRIVDHATARHE